MLFRSCRQEQNQNVEDFYVDLSAWVFMNFGHNNLFSRAYFWRPFEYFSLMLSPIFLSAYIMLLKPKYKRFWKVLMITDSGWCVIMFFMNRMNIFHVNETMYITHIFIVITCIGTLRWQNKIIAQPTRDRKAHV